MVATTTFVVLFWFTQEHFNGSLMEMLNYILENGVVNTLKHGVYGGVGGYDGMVPTKEHWKILGYFSAFELVLMRLPLGRGVHGPGIARGQRSKICRQCICIIHYHARYICCRCRNGMVERLNIDHELGTNASCNEYLRTFLLYFPHCQGFVFSLFQ